VTLTIRIKSRLIIIVAVIMICGVPIVVITIAIAMIAIIIVIIVTTGDDSRTIDAMRDTRIVIPREDRLRTVLVTALLTRMDRRLRTTADPLALCPATWIRSDEPVGREVDLDRR
jgi:hypothetical protein